VLEGPEWGFKRHFRFYFYAVHQEREGDRGVLALKKSMSGAATKLKTQLPTITGIVILLSLQISWLLVNQVTTHIRPPIRISRC
jgi:hypothetical protein